MTLEEFGQLLGSIDPGVRRYYTAQRGAFTTWAEYRRIPAYADGRPQGGWKVQVERYTPKEHDPIAAAIESALNARDDVAVDYEVDINPETGVIRHLFDCEVW